MITATNERPLSPKHQAAPSPVSARPPSIGPITRARLNWMEFSAMALGRSSFSTSDGHQRRVGRTAEGLRAAHHERQAEDVPDLHHLEREQHSQQERAGHLHILRAEQHAAAVDAVGDHAADQRKQHDGDLAQEAVQAQQERRTRRSKAPASSAPPPASRCRSTRCRRRTRAGGNRGNGKP